MDYAVIVCDLFNAHDPDHETLIEGFATAEEAIEYARRRTRASVEEIRRPEFTAEEIHRQWRSFGEDCRVIGPEGVIYLASSELEVFIDHPATAEERDWSGYYHDLQKRRSTRTGGLSTDF